MKKDKYGVQYSNSGKTLKKFPKYLEGEYVIPDGVEVISDWALRFEPKKIKLSSIKISKSVKNVGDINDYSYLDFISIDPDNPVYDSRDNCNAIIETKSNTLIYAGKHSFIPDGVQIVNSSAFSAYEGSKLYIPSSVKKIERRAFRELSFSIIEVDAANKHYDSRENCNAIIETATNKLILGCANTVIPFGVEIIGEGDFAGCMSMDKMVLPDSVLRIDANSFCHAQIQELYISKSVEQIYFQLLKIMKFKK